MLLALVSIGLAACGTRSMGPGASAPDPSAAAQVDGAPGAAEREEARAATEPSAMDLDAVAGELPAPAQQGPHPLEHLSDSALEELLLSAPEELGPASLGRTNAGALFGAVAMPESDHWQIVNSRETFGTAETVAYLSHAIERVNEVFPETPALNIGDISKPEGGHFKPHVSHQSGRDVDLGFYYQDGNQWYAQADASNLDLPRTWTFIKVTVTETDVEAIFVDRSIQSLLRDYATELGESEAWLDQVFGGPSSSLRPILLHEPGHKTHLHIRYYNPIAQETGRRVYRALVKHKKVKPPTSYVKYKVKRGDSLIRIAKKHKVTVDALKKANRLRNNRIYAGRSYKIPKRSGVAQPPRLVLPARRLPLVAGSASGSSATSVSAPSDH